MSGIGKRLLDSTADLAAAVAAKSALRGESTTPSVPRTAPGQMLAARAETLSLQSELAELRDRLREFDGSLPTLKLDPKAIRVSHLANRHETSFSTPAFARLQASIEAAGGNTQPILVRPIKESGGYEVVFGHRRHRACFNLGYPVLSVVWNGPMGDLELFLSMDRENREREDPSAYEQGTHYVAALEAGLFQSQRRLAEAIGVSHTWVRKALTVAQMPPAIIAAFRSPLEIQPRHAEEIALAMDQDKKSVLRRAEKVRQMAKKPAAGQVVALLVGRAESGGAAQKLHAGDRSIGSWRRDSKGRAVITIDAAVADDATMEKVAAALVQLASKRAEVET